MRLTRFSYTYNALTRTMRVLEDANIGNANIGKARSELEGHFRHPMIALIEDLLTWVGIAMFIQPFLLFRITSLLNLDSASLHSLTMLSVRFWFLCLPTMACGLFLAVQLSDKDRSRGEIAVATGLILAISFLIGYFALTVPL